MRAQAKSPPWTTLFFALLGLAWCGYVAFPTTTPLPCSTSGCALFRDTKFAGLSLWWVGGAYFFLLAVICLRGNRHLARMLAGLALFLDALLLVIMFLTAPCFDCLVVAVFIGMCYYTLRPSAHPDGWFTGGENSRSLLLPIWFGLLLGNAVLAANEQLPQYNLGNPQARELSVYFSPSCPACREALTSLGRNASLYPVEESEADRDSIIKLGALLKAGVPMKDALSRCLDDNEPVPALPFYESLLIQMQLLRNKAALMRQGFRALPLIQVNGMPGGPPNTPLERSSLTPREQAPAPAAIPAPQSAAGAADRSAGQAPSDLSPRHTDDQLPPDQSYQGQASPGDSGFPAREEGVAGGAQARPQEQPGDAFPDFLNDQSPLRQCGGDNPEPCD